MQPDRFTIKSQEAIQAAQHAGRRAPQPAGDPRAPARRRCSSRTAASSSRPAQARRRRREPIRADVNAALDALPTLGEGGEAPAPASELVAVLRARRAEARELNDEYVSTEHLLLALSQAKARGRRGAARRRRHPRRAAAGARRGARLAPRHRPEPRGQVPGAREVRPRPHRGRRAGQARPGHRPRRRDPPRHPGALAAAPRTTRC